MKPLRPRLSGLVFRLALFYVLLSLPSLALVESVILVLEFHHVAADIRHGSLERAAAEAQRELAAWWPSSGDAMQDRAALKIWCESWVLRLQRPRGGLVGEESYVLMELSAEPFAAAILDAQGDVIARAPDVTGWTPNIPRPGEAGFATALAGRTPVDLEGADGSHMVRRLLTPLHDADGHLRGLLYLELHIPVPWRTLMFDLSFEWPIVLGHLIVFGLASSLFLATWVTRRLNRIAHAATSWSRGDFSAPIADPSNDELGHVAALLDNMAIDLRDLLRSRAQLATLAERQRLARDLHDTVKQKAFALNLQLATMRRQLDGHAALPRAVQAERLSQQIQQELAQILDELRASDAGLPFAERLRMRVLEWAHVSGIHATLDLQDVPSLRAEDEDALLRIADEALSNVLRHAHASDVAITLRRETERLALTITDNGRGAAADAVPGMGLANMRSRAHSLPDGRFEFDGAITNEGGTCVRVSFSIAGTSTS